MPKKLYKVELTSDERNHLKNLTSSGSAKARKLTHARILLKADEGWTDEEIAEALDVSCPTVERVRLKYVSGDLASALERRPAYMNASLMGEPKPIWWHWSVERRPADEVVGPCASSATSW